MTEEAGAVPPRERGWLGPILALVGFALLTSDPSSRVVTPVADLLLLLAPVTAACAVAGWRAGGRLPLAVIWTAFAAWIVWRSSAQAGLFHDLTRGWAVLLALTFGVLVSVDVGERFLGKALLALAAALLVGLAVLVVVPGGFESALDLVRGEIGRRAMEATRDWQARTGSPEWIELARESPRLGAFANDVGKRIEELPAIGLRFFPALLGLQSLAVMALGWAVYHRVGRARLGPPLTALRELRFHDAVVWGVVLGLTLVALPLPEWARDAGLNLLLFFGVLYALRGMGVLIWFLAPGRVMSVVLVAFTVVFWPVVLMVAAGLGLGDTWFDWRRATRQRSQRSE